MTLNELVNLFKQLAIDHKQINSFGFGVNSELDISNKVYPQMYVEIEPIALNGKDVTIPFSFIFSDRVTKDLRNETDVISDMMSVSLDIRALLMSPTYFDSFAVDISGTITPFRDSTDDETAGVILDLGIKITDLKDRCQVPL